MGFTKSETKVLREIKKYVKNFLSNLSHTDKRYDFWFVYDEDDAAISWEGGFNLSSTNQFRNQYSIQDGKKVVKNWD